MKINSLPSQIMTPYNKLLCKVAAVDCKGIPNLSFDVHAEGYVFNNAKQEIERD